MSLTQVITTKPLFGANEGVWEYRDKDNNLLGYVVRKSEGPNKKYFVPWSFQNHQWVKKWYENQPKPIYNIYSIYSCPEKPILIVEGEKTAEAGIKLFPDYNVITWMNGSKAFNKVDWSHLTNKKIYLLPDNDQSSYDAFEQLTKILISFNNEVHFCNISALGVDKGWDIADLDYGTVDFEDVIDLVSNAKIYTPKFDLIDSDKFPDLSSKFRPINTTDNIAYLLNHYQIKVRYNLMTNYPEFYCPGKNFSSVNEADCYFTEICNLCVKNGVPKVDLDAHLLLIAERNNFHPAIDFIESNAWDGISRVDSLIHTIEADDQELAYKLIYRWLIGAVTALYTKEGVSLEGVLVFQGRQKLGKTYWFMKLVPEYYRFLLKAGQNINPNNKDDVMRVTSSWLCELAEIEGTIKKSDISAQKAFITQSIDYYRVPFGKRVRAVPRRTSFYGSVNQVHYLSDDTGNRRYWTVSVKSIDFNHDIDMQQVWAELKHLFDKGETYRLTEEEQLLLNSGNESFQSMDPLEELIIKRFRWDDDRRTNPMSPAEVLNALGYSMTDHNINPMAKKCSGILAKLTGKKSRKSNGRMVYDLPFEQLSRI